MDMEMISMAGKNIKYKDINIEGGVGNYLCTAMVKGRFVHRTYMWFSKGEAKLRFYEYCNSL